MYKIFIGRAEKGGTTQQEAEIALKAATQLENLLNDKKNKVESIAGFFVQDTSPLHVELLALAVVTDPVSVKVVTDPVSVKVVTDPVSVKKGE